MPSLTLSNSQKHAVRELVYWYNNPTPFVTMGGYAGTGKTTVIGVYRNFLNSKVNIRVAFCSYTGKATRVLEQRLKEHKGICKQDTIGTIHSLIYEAIKNSEGEVVGWTKRKSLNYDMIIVDEASMVDTNIWSDLLSYNIPIIAVGDHGQLPPVNGTFNLMDNPQLTLEEIYRQAKDNPIIELSIKVRNGEAIEPGTYAPGVKKIDRLDEMVMEELDDAMSSNIQETLILCGFNTTRVRLNESIRQKNERFTDPVVNDRVICLKNNHEKRIANGMLGTIKSIEPDEENLYYAKIEMDNGVIFRGLIDATMFNNPKSSQERTKGGDIDYFDFGYALTVHKAQGSQAKKVVLFEERSQYMNDDEWAKWLYTGITRAEEELVIVG